MGKHPRAETDAFDQEKEGSEQDRLCESNATRCTETVKHHGEKFAVAS